MTARCIIPQPDKICKCFLKNVKDFLQKISGAQKTSAAFGLRQRFGGTIIVR